MTRNEASDAWGEERRDGYYSSITDMMIGLLFLFIIMLMYFALQLRTTTEQLITAEQTRNELLEKVATYLRERDVHADIDVSAGVLRLPDQILFEKGRDQPKPQGLAALNVLANGLAIHLPCYSFRARVPRPVYCAGRPHHVEAIFIEGHTDSDPIKPNARLRDNWDLSVARASNTYRIVSAARPDLSEFMSSGPNGRAPRQIFSVAGYADQRPVAPGSDETAMERNRRIDVRIIMAGPEPLD